MPNLFPSRHHECLLVLFKCLLSFTRLLVYWPVVHPIDRSIDRWHISPCVDVPCFFWRFFFFWKPDGMHEWWMDEGDDRGRFLGSPVHFQEAKHRGRGGRRASRKVNGALPLLHLLLLLLRCAAYRQVCSASLCPGYYAVQWLSCDSRMDTSCSIFCLPHGSSVSFFVVPRGGRSRACRSLARHVDAAVLSCHGLG